MLVKLATELESARAQLQLKVTLQGIKPAIWRRLLVPANIKLPKFDAVLQHAFDWTNSHLHAFRIGEQSYEAYDPNSGTIGRAGRKSSMKASSGCATYFTRRVIGSRTCMTSEMDGGTISESKKYFR